MSVLFLVLYFLSFALKPLANPRSELLLTLFACMKQCGANCIVCLRRCLMRDRCLKRDFVRNQRLPSDGKETVSIPDGFFQHMSPIKLLSKHLLFSIRLFDELLEKQTVCVCLCMCLRYLLCIHQGTAFTHKLHGCNGLLQQEHVAPLILTVLNYTTLKKRHKNTLKASRELNESRSIKDFLVPSCKISL